MKIQTFCFFTLKIHRTKEFWFHENEFLNLFKKMDLNKIKATLESALQLLNKELGTEILNQTKEEYLRVINEIQQALKEFA